MDQLDVQTDNKDPLKSLSHEQLLELFRCNKKKMSRMDHPHNFLNQLCVHELIPEEVHQNLRCMKSKEQREKVVYQTLEWLEEKGPQCIQKFWRCVFRNHILQQYPTLLLLHNSLLDDQEMPPGALTVEKDEKENKKKILEEVEDFEEKKTGKKKRKNAKGNVSSEEEEQPSTSTQTTRSPKKKVQKPVFCSLKKGEKAEIWNWPLYKTQLPVTCGDQRGTLYRDKLARGEKCILLGDQWLTTFAFEAFAGKNIRKNWKTSIRCEGTTLEKLIQDGHLTAPRIKEQKVGQSKRALFPIIQSASSSSDSEHDVNEEEKEEQESAKESHFESDTHILFYSSDSEHEVIEDEEANQESENSDSCFESGSEHEVNEEMEPELESLEEDSDFESEKKKMGLVKDSKRKEFGGEAKRTFSKKRKTENSMVSDSEHEDQEADDEEVEEKESEEGVKGEQTTTAGVENPTGGSLDVLPNSVFQVTCGSVDGILHKERFASGQSSEIWTWPEYKTQLPVTCGDQRGTLYRDKMARGEECIQVGDQWFTPTEFETFGGRKSSKSWKTSIRCQGTTLKKLIQENHLTPQIFKRRNLGQPKRVPSINQSAVSSSDSEHEVNEEEKEKQESENGESHFESAKPENDDKCFICRRQGSLKRCDECTHSFHQSCHLPNVEGNGLKWVCTFCVLRISQAWRRPVQNTYQEVLNYRTSDHLMECQYLLLSLYHEDEDRIFVKDPRINVRNYSTVIKTPMWLDEVTRKLQNKQYQTVKHFVTDVLLIFTNCATFNRDNAEVAKKLKDAFDREFKKAFGL
ncbi:hypothetical protein DPEC_G00275100 [Dallia pectoralis]|uniref:Uncharacterized protein n=1 Tax=Dallia pectoralis TaxID=75939 RepID=A0ACC2FLI9_DALPE|nr:hypothetical protein DPEC_G00275100 [Dallia pectoralis]